MTIREAGENFKAVLSTKGTLIGLSPSKFVVTYANINDLVNKIVVIGGATEAGNLGVYVTQDIIIPTVGEYFVTIECIEYNIIAEQRVKIVPQGELNTDGTVAVAY